MTSLNEVPVKRKRGRPPKKQPVDVYMSFTSLFQALTSSTSPSAESNSNLMVKLGEPNSFTPMMKVTPSVVPKKPKRRRTNSFGILLSRLRSPSMASYSCSPTSRRADIGLPTPATTRSNATPTGTQGLELDYKLSEEVFNLGVFKRDDSAPHLCSKSRSLSNFDLPYESSQYTPRLSLSSACHSDLEPYCRTVNLASLDEFEDEEIFGMTRHMNGKITTDEKSPTKCIDKSDQVSFNLVVDGRGRASFSLDGKEMLALLMQTTEKSSMSKLDLESNCEANEAPAIGLQPMESDPTHMLQNRDDNNAESFVDRYHFEAAVDKFEANFNLTPQFNSMMNTMMNVSSPPHENWSCVINYFPESQMHDFHETNPYLHNQQCSVPIESTEADTSSLYKTVNVNTLPGSEAGDAGAALRRAFGMP